MVHSFEEKYLEACWERLRRILGPVLLKEIWPGKEYTITKGSSTEKLEDGSLKLSYWVDVKAKEEE